VGIEFAGGGWYKLLACAAAAAFVLHARRSRARPWLLLLRGLAIFGLIAALIQPSVTYREPLRRKPKLLILVDASHSMRGKAGRSSRLEAAAAWLQKNRGRIEERADVVLFSLAAQGRRLAGFEELKSLSPANAAFEPNNSLRDVAEDPAANPPPARVWLLSDGNAEASDGWEGALGALKAPVDVIGVGPLRRGKSLSFIDIKTPDFAFLHGAFQVQATVEAAAMSGEALGLRLLRQQQGSEGWSVLQEQTVRAGSDYETVSATFTAIAQSLGTEHYRLEVAEPAQAGSAKHAREFRVEVIRQKYRIMYLAGRPSAEYAFLREFLKSDPNHELVSFVILRNPENPTFVPDNELSLIPFPAEEIFVQNLNQFDLFILENFSYARFRLPPAYLASLRNFVTQGGALLVVGGENAFDLGGYRGTPLEEMLPVTLSASAPDFVNGLFKAKPVAPAHPLVRLFDTAEASAAAWDALPAMDGWARFGAVRPGATVLAVHPTERTAQGEPLPVLAIRDYGRGKVMLASSDSTWRWKLGAAADWRVGSFYARFWTRAVQYLTGSLDLSKVKFAPLPDRLPAREPAMFSLRVFDESFRPAEKGAAELSVLWTPPGGRPREVMTQETEPGVFSIELTGLAVGAHALKAVAKLHGRAWGEDQIHFNWEGAAAEAPMDRRWLKRAAEAGGGSMEELVSVEAPTLLDRLPAVRLEAEVRRQLYPWASPAWLWLTAALFILEWALRRWQGHA
jgi:uncharacterized membrane protein